MPSALFTVRCLRWECVRLHYRDRNGAPCQPLAPARVCPVCSTVPRCMLSCNSSHRTHIHKYDAASHRPGPMPTGWGVITVLEAACSIAAYRSHPTWFHTVLSFRETGVGMHCKPGLVTDLLFSQEYSESQTISPLTLITSIISRQALLLLLHWVFPVHRSHANKHCPMLHHTHAFALDTP